MAENAGHDSGSDEKAPERLEYEAMRPGYWSDVVRRRRIAAIAAVAAVVLLATAGYIASRSGRPSAVSPGESTRTITPAEPTVEPTWTVVPTYTVPATGAPGETGGPGSGSEDPGTPPGVSEPGSAVAAVERATRVAYRRDGWLCVSAEDGTGEIRVAESAGGVFSLSPDGRTLAFVDGESRLLVLTDVAARLTVSVGAALAERPSWSPDSAWLVYTAPGPVVVRISRNGSGATRLFDGRLPAVATSGGVVVGTVPGDGPREIVVWRADRVARASVDANVSALACDGSTVYFGAGLPHVGAATLRAVGIAGSDARVLVGASVATRVVAISDLVLSPDGRTLVYAEHGDDGYSRAFLLPATGGTPVALSSRRDCYPLQWSADGRSLFLIEGNAFQGETTALVRAPSDGSTRRRIVGGAGL